MRISREVILGCGLVIQLTLMVIVAVVLPLLLGIWLDRFLHTSPWITLVMTLLGITLGSVSVYRTVASEYKRVGGSKS